MPFVLEALHALRVAITVLDRDERLTFANQHLNYLFRTLPPRESLLGQSYEQLIRLLAEGGEIADAAPAGLQDGPPRDLMLRDGRIVEIKARRTPGGWIILWNDVTAARHATWRLEDAIALTADSFAFFDRKDALVLCNEEFARAHGAEAPGDIAGRSFGDLAETLLSSGRIKADRDWLKRRLAVHHETAGAMTIETAAGEAFLLRDRATADGGRVVVMTDVTEHHRAETALAEQTRTLDRTRQALAKSKAESERQASYLADLAIKLDQTAAVADSAKNTLLRTMSHELKTPLNAIIGFSDLLATLAEKSDPQQVKEYAGLIHQGGKNLLRLINQILDLSKITAGRYELRRHPIDAGVALGRARDGFEDRAMERNIRLDCTCAPGVTVEADENALCAMLNNLVENAVQFTQEGGEVHLKAEAHGKRVRISVADNGPGVSAQDLARIVLPFEHGGRSEHGPGAGLGLTVVKALAELQGGVLTLQSEAGAGFTAIVELPAAVSLS